MEERAGKGPGKGKGKGANDGFHPSKGKGKGQPKAGKGKGHGKEPAQASAVRLDPVLETAYQVYLSGRRPDQPRVSRAAWLRNNVRSDFTFGRKSETGCKPCTVRPLPAPSRLQLQPQIVSRVRPLPASRPHRPSRDPEALRASGTHRPVQPPAPGHLSRPGQQCCSPARLAVPRPTSRGLSSKRPCQRHLLGQGGQQERQRAPSMQSMLSTCRWRQ